jgi:hypothetical protein
MRIIQHGIHRKYENTNIKIQNNKNSVNLHIRLSSVSIRFVGDLST